VLLIIVASRYGSGKANVTVPSILSIEVEFDASSAEQAKASIRKAAKDRGDEQIDVVERVIDGTRSVRLARLLWVDDNPDNNVYETVALEKLGLLITKAISTASGLFYLERLRFSLAVTDLGRPEGPEVGIEFIRAVKRLHEHVPVIVYTTNADSVRERLIKEGAEAVVDQPGDLVQTVLAVRSRRITINGQ